MTRSYLSGGEQTTINSTITELFPALAFNTSAKFRSTSELETYIRNLNLSGIKASKTFVNSGNVDAATKAIDKLDLIRPSIKDTKLKNAIGILNYLYEYNKKRKIEKVIWGYREKPRGVPNNHAGDIFIVHADKKVEPNIVGISLKAGTKSSKEPKLNSYVGTTLRKDVWKKKYPNIMDDLKDKLWNDVYSKIPGVKENKNINSKSWIELTGSRQKPSKVIQEYVLALFKTDPLVFEALYVRMNMICRKTFIELINKDINSTKNWIEEEFRLEKKDVEVPMILVKAIGSKAESSSTDPLRDILPQTTKIKAYLKPGSVQEWFIDLITKDKKKLTLNMTIRSDSEYREAKQKGKLGAYLMLKLLYRGS